MATARHPARQLNSKAIKDVILSYMVPVVQDAFYVVHAKATWRVEKDADALRKAWNLVCEKREECDDAIKGLGNLAFYFSAISSCEPPSKGKGTGKGKNASSNSNLEDEESEMLPQSQQPSSYGPSSSINLAVEKERFPAISYWMAFASRNGAPISLAPIRRRLIRCDVEVDVKPISNGRHKTSIEMTKSLCHVMKDHNSSFMKDVVDSSFEHCRREAIMQLGEDELFSEDEEDQPESVLRFSLLTSTHCRGIDKALRALSRAGLKMDLQGIELTDDEAQGNESTSMRSLTTDQTTQLINDIEILMSKLGYALHRGMIHKKEEKAMYTYTYKCDVNSFIGTLEGNESLKARLSKYGKSVKEKLQNAETQFIRQLKVDHDLIEVSGGWCLSLSRRQFVQHAVSEEDIGHVSPRAFCEYNHEKEPDPKYFREILENSLNPDEITQFCTDYMGLLQFQNKQHKQKVPCIVGAADSGKTSLFAPIFGVVPPIRVATVTKQRAFNKALINEDTEVIFVDEASTGSMDVDDWKLLTQGGWNVHTAKYRKARPFVNRCPMLITCQTKLTFSDPEDQKAMDARLTVYHFKQLPKKEPSAFEWLRKHPLDCIVWAMGMARQSETAVHQDNGKQGQLTDSEKDALLLFKFDQDGSEDECHGREGAESVEEHELYSQVESLRDALGAECNPFRKGVYRRLLERTAERRREEDEAYQRRVEGRRSFLLELGIDEQLAERMPEDANESYPDTLRRAVDDCVGQRRKAEEEEKRRQAEEVFKGTWLLEKEKELVQLSNELDTSGDDMDRDVRSGKEYCLQVLVKAITFHHRSAKTDPAHGIAVRRETYVQNGWLTRGQAEASIVDLCAPPCLAGESLSLSNLTQMTPPTSQDGTDKGKRGSATQEQQQQLATKRQRSMFDFFSKSQL